MPKDALPAYTPRWLYRFFAFIDGLPLPGWALAALVIVGIAAAAHMLAWSRGVLPVGRFDLFLAAIGFYLVTWPAEWHFLTWRARPAITDFFKGRRPRAGQIEATLSDFVSLPSLWTVLVFVLGGLVGRLVYVGGLRPLMPATGQVVAGLIAFNSIVSGGFAFIIIARIVRQSLLTRRFYREMEVDLFNPSPVYALSRYSGLSIIAVLSGIYLLQIVALPALLLSGTVIIIEVIIDGVLLLFFLGQLVGINRRMREAKELLLIELNKDIEGVYNDVHEAVHRKAYASVARMQASMATLRNEQEILRKIPTWPWQPETLRNLLTPMLIPVIVYIVQRFLGTALGF